MCLDDMVWLRFMLVSFCMFVLEKEFTHNVDFIGIGPSDHICEK